MPDVDCPCDLAAPVSTCPLHGHLALGPVQADGGMCGHKSPKVGDYRYRCNAPAGHEGEHRQMGVVWTSEQAGGERDA